MKNISRLTILSIFLLTLFACRKDIDESSITPVPNDPIITTIDYTPERIDVTATIFGIVTNEDGFPEAEATVRLENNTTTTDARGRFVFSNITMNKAGTFLTVNKPGFFEGSDRFFPEDGSTNYTTIILLSQNNIGSFASNEGGNFVSDLDQIELDFPPNSIVDQEGFSYNGDVIVNARWVDPTADNVNEVMPGGLQGIQDGGEGEEAELVALASYGMMTVELTTPNGVPLNLGNDSNAELKFPIPDELLDNAPATIPLWSFSNEYGVWVKEGSATKEGDFYVGEVSHFSWWNCDDPYTLIELSGTLLNEDDSPLAYGDICLEIISSGEIGCISSDQDGFFSGPVPINEEFILTASVADSCGVIYTTNVGPFSADHELDPIIIPDDNNTLVSITGTVIDCSNNPLTNGWVELVIGQNVYTRYVNDGTYSLSFHNCFNETELTVQGIDITGLEEGDLSTFTISPNMTIPQISACGTMLDEFFKVTVNDSTTTFLSPYAYVNSDTFQVSANDNFVVYLGLEPVNDTGTYNSDVITGFTAYISTGDSSGGTLTGNCSPPLCDLTINITEHGTNQGDIIAGNYSGDVVFLDNNSQPTTYFMNAEFRVILY